MPILLQQLISRLSPFNRARVGKRWLQLRCFSVLFNRLHVHTGTGRFCYWGDILWWCQCNFNGNTMCETGRRYNVHCYGACGSPCATMTDVWQDCVVWIWQSKLWNACLQIFSDVHMIKLLVQNEVSTGIASKFAAGSLHTSRFYDTHLWARGIEIGISSRRNWSTTFTHKHRRRYTTGDSL